jgi:hypothetical protein
MARFPSSGSGIVSPIRVEAELGEVLADLCTSYTFDELAIDEIYLKLGIIVGKWLSEQERVEVDPIAKALLRMARNLSEVSHLMSGLELGLRNRFEITVASHVAKYLALEPTIGSADKARELMSSLRRQADQVSHVCMVGYVDLSNQAGKRGRLASEWYDDFTALLLEVAAKAGVQPRNSKNRDSTKIRSGWLFDAAMALETFFYRDMRSPSAEACGKRLERSRKRLRAPARQKPSAG